MCVIRKIALIGAAFVACTALADMPSYHVANPIGWMYALPVGEAPGWSSPRWFNVEISQSNVWNMESSFTDRRTGDVYTYEADYEQSTTVIETGFAAGSLGFALEVPYANHNGGFLDDFIDQFHTLGRFDRFLRDYNPMFGNHFHIRKNGVDQLSTSHAEGVGNLKAKFKWWLLPWKSPTPGACECGFALSTHVKFPLQPRARGLTSGKTDVTGMAHLGIPFAKYTGAWATAAVTKLGYNETFAGLPQRRWQQMYELTLNLGINRNFGLLLQARVESPLFEQKYLSFNYSYADKDLQAAEREASGWNAMTEWRGSETAGVVYRWGEGSQVNLMIMEDWGLGDRDHNNTWNYVNNAPDVGFITQWHFVF